MHQRGEGGRREDRAGDGIRHEGCKYKGPSGKAFLRRGHLSRDLKEVREASGRNLGEGHSYTVLPSYQQHKRVPGLP